MLIYTRCALEFFAVLMVYTMSFWVVDLVIMPIQVVYFPVVSEHICLLFLPHAIRLLTIWMYRFKGLIYMLIVCQFSYYFIYENHPTNNFHFLGPFVAPLTAYGFLEIFKRCGNDPYQIKNWKTLIIIGILCSIVNGYVLAVLYGIDSPTVWNTFYFALGDFNGLLLILLIMFGYFKIERRFFNSAHGS